MALWDNKKGVRTTALTALLLLAALILSYVEALIPISWFYKLGLANIAITLTVMLVSRRAGLLVTVLRVLISSMLFGTVTAFWFSLCGGFAAWLTTSLTKVLRDRERMTLVGVSVLSAAAHNIGQTAAACILLLSSSPLYILPWLLLFSVFTGIITGVISEIIYTRLRKHI